MARILRAASVLAVSSNLDMIRSRPYLRFRLPFRPSTALRAQASLYICLASLAPVSPFLGRPRAGPVRRISAVFSVLVDLIGKDCFRVASKLTEVLFRYSLEITPLVEVAPARLFQICIALYDGQMKLLAEFRWIWAFSPVNGADKGLLQAHNAIFANVSVVFVHLFLLSVYAWNHLKPVLKIPRKFCIWNQTHQL